VNVMQRRTVLDAGLGVLVIGLGLLIAGQNSRFLAQVQPRRPRPVRPVVPKGPIVYPAIPVQQTQGGSAIRPTRPSEAPALTPDDVRRFLVSTPGALSGSGATKASISRIDCSLTARDVSNVLRGKNTGLPDNMPLCYVELSGNFTYFGPSSPRSSHGTTLTFHTAFRAFDARTGNLMLTGAFDRPQ
jgi:hypothetical protein